MNLITLAEFKEHARIDHDDEDASAILKIEAASEYILGFISDAPPSETEVTADLKQAALLIVSHWHEHRENSFAGSIGDIPLDAQAILINRRSWSF